MLLLSMLISSAAVLTAAERWPLWDSYARTFVEAQGRVVEHDEQSKTTSEAQAYAMFFALVANDKETFDQLLKWTETNLAQGDLTARLPGWSWGQSSNETWGLLDSNSATDADVWLSYTLLAAGNAWHESRYSKLGHNLAAQVVSKEVVNMPGFGPILLPAPSGFRDKDTYILNPSYVPLPLIAGMAVYEPKQPWKDIAKRIPKLIQRSSPQGIAMDWVSYTNHRGFFLEGPQGKSSVGSYDAIRVYLWAGMTHPQAQGRREILSALSGISGVLNKTVLPPAVLDSSGDVLTAEGGVGFSAALFPFLSASRESRLEDEQRRRVLVNFHAASGLYGDPPHYYDQNLAMFAIGWSEGRFRFDAPGNLILRWRTNNE